MGLLYLLTTGGMIYHQVACEPGVIVAVYTFLVRDIVVVGHMTMRFADTIREVS